MFQKKTRRKCKEKLLSFWTLWLSGAGGMLNVCPSLLAPGAEHREQRGRGAEKGETFSVNCGRVLAADFGREV